MTTAEEELTWNDVQSKKAFSFNMGDRMAFGPELSQREVSLEVAAKCSSGDLNWSSRQIFTGAREFSIGQLLPEDLLTRTILRLVTCRLDFAAKNKNGSQHIFSLNEISVRPSYDAFGVRIKKDGQFLTEINPPVAEIPASDWSRYFAKSPPGRTTQLFCEQHQIAFPQISEFQSFAVLDQGAAVPRYNKNLAVSVFHQQYCRVLAKAPHQPSYYSPLLRITFTPTTLEFQKEIPGDSVKSLVLGVFRLKNTTPGPIQLLMGSKEPLQAQIIHVQGTAYHSQTLPVILSGPAGTPPLVKLMPEETIELTVKIPHKVFCSEFQLVHGIPVGRILVLAEGAGPQIIQSSDGYTSESELIPGALIQLLPPGYMIGAWIDQPSTLTLPTMEQLAKFHRHPNACSSR